MATSVSSVSQTPPVEATDTTVRAKPREMASASEPQPAGKTTVTISPAARAAAAAAAEATETPAVAEKEAMNGDRQAQARVAKLDAEKIALHQAS